MYMLLFFMYPFYKYYIDPDGTAYLTISNRYAVGDFANAVNAYWSPWSCWFTALLIKGGVMPIPASVIINSLGASGFLFISQSYFLKFNIHKLYQWLLNFTLLFFLCYAVFAQSFDDIWQCFFLLSALRLLLVAEFCNKPILWVLYGIIGALAYFAKAYSFPFFIFNTLICVFFIVKLDKIKWLKICLVALSSFFICCFPWLYLLHTKYGIWTSSTAGSLNLSWYLIGHPIWNNGIHNLIPPILNGSPYYWEDPYLVNSSTPHFWDSWQLLGMQIIRFFYTLYKFNYSIFQISIAFPIIIFVFYKIVKFRKARMKYPEGFFIISLSFLLFPLAYLLINFESRYIWYLVPLSMLLGTYIIQNNLIKLYFNYKPTYIIVLFCISYLVYPAIQLKNMYNKGREEYNLALVLKENNRIGSFTGNIKTANMARLAYFSGNQYYYVAKPKIDLIEIQKEMIQYDISYLFVLPFNSSETIPNIDTSLKKEHLLLNYINANMQYTWDSINIKDNRLEKEYVLYKLVKHKL